LRSAFLKRAFLNCIIKLVRMRQVVHRFAQFELLGGAVERLEDRKVMDANYFSLAGGNFSQNWAGTSALLTADNWSGVASIEGNLGDNSSAAGTDPQTVLAPYTDIDLVNSSSSAATAGGVHEINDTVVALQGSGGANNPHLVFHVNTTGRESVTITYDLIELDSTTVNQMFALQYRLAATGNYVNVPAGAVSSVFNASGNQTQNVSVTLPSAVDNQSQVQIRVITNDASGADAMVGIDNIVIASAAAASDTDPPTLTSINDNDADDTINAGNTLNYTVTFDDDIDHTTVDASDFSNAGTSTITFGTITETSANSGVFTVPVTATSTGTVQLQIPAGATIKDDAGNDLVTTSALLTGSAVVTVNAPDVTPPTLTTIDDGDADDTVVQNTVMTYVVTFDEDIDSTTVSAADFDNAGTATISIGTITETSASSGVFNVQVTPTTSGTIQLRIPTTATITDAAGNALVVSPALLDDTTVNVTGLPNVLLNEVLVNPAGSPDDPYEYIELRGTPSLALSNIYVVSIEGDNGTGGAGVADMVIDLTAASLGTSGLLIMKSPTGGFTPGAGTAIVTDTQFDTSGGGIENGTVSHLIIYSTSALVETTDYDTDNDGILESLPSGAAIIDAVGWSDGGGTDIVYGGVALTQTSGTPDAATRFLLDTTPNSLSAWYNGDLANGVPTSMVYDTLAASSNLPAGAILTPGAPNTTDTTAPSLTNIDDGDADDIIDTGNLLTYVVSFSEDINGSTVDASDFSNAGTATIVFGTISETAGGVFSIQVTPTTAGTLILQVNPGAVISDLIGLNLDTAAAITDADTLTVNTAVDVTPPTLNSIDDGDADDTVNAGAVLTYTITFDEDIDALTLTAADVANSGTAGISIGTITEPSPGLFNVQVTATTDGTLILQIVAGAVITDTAANPLNTTAALNDNDTVTVNPIVAPAVVLNELSVNQPGTDNPYEYIELRGPASQSLSNIYVVVVEGDGTNAGIFDRVFNLGTASLGSNGLLMLRSSTGHAAADANTTVFDSSVFNTSGGGIENGSNTYLVIFSTVSLTATTDYDPENDGTLNLPVGATVIDAIGWQDAGAGTVYGPMLTQSSGTPDAATRFVNSTTPNDLASWYNADLTGINISLTYDETKASANFPAGVGILTPGDANVGLKPEPPVVTPTGATLSYTENSTIAVDSALTVSDSDSTNLTGATISILSGFDSTQDVLAFTNTANISGVYDSGTGVLTLTGVDTLAAYEAALRSITYNNTSDLPSTANRIVELIVNDTIGGFFSAPSSRTISITRVNDAPTGVVTVLGGASPSETVTAETFALADLDGLGALSYQWQRSLDNFATAPGIETISGATSSLYTIPVGDTGYHLRVVVSYTDGAGTNETVNSASTVAVVNGNAPIISTNDNNGLLAIYNRTESEPLAITATATDVNLGDILTFSIDNTQLDANDFTINPTTGVLSFVTGSKDFETPRDIGLDNIYEVIVKVTDSIGFFDSQVLQITITDINEAPYFTTVNSELTRLENFTGEFTDVERETNEDGPVQDPASPNAVSATTSFDGRLEIRVRDEDNENGAGSSTLAPAIGTVAQSLVFQIIGGADAALFSIAKDNDVDGITAVGVTPTIMPADNNQFAVLEFLGDFAGDDTDDVIDANSDGIFEVIVQVSDGVNVVTKDFNIQITKQDDNNQVFTSSAARTLVENTTDTLDTDNTNNVNAIDAPLANSPSSPRQISKRRWEAWLATATHMKSSLPHTMATPLASIPRNSCS
jgi:hypothetical protein